MNTIMLIFRREVQSFLMTPKFYFLLSIWMLINHYTLCALFYYLKSGLALSFWASNTALLVLLLGPLLGMNLWADDRQNGTDILLKTAPIQPTAIVFGKFLAIWGIMGAMIFSSIPIAITIAIWSKTSIWGVVVSFLAQGVLAGLVCGIGIFWGIVFDTPIGVALLTWIFSLILWMLAGLFSWLPKEFQPLVTYFSLQANWESISKNEITVQNVLYFIAMIAILLLLANVLYLKRTPHRPQLIRKSGGCAILSLAILLLMSQLAPLPIAQGNSGKRLAESTKKFLKKITVPIRCEIVGEWGPEKKRLIQLLSQIHQTNPLISILENGEPSGEPKLRISKGAQQFELGLGQLFVLYKTDSREDFLGESVINTRLFLLTHTPPKLWWIQGHHENSPEGSGPDGLSQIKESLDHEGYEQQSITMGTLPQNSEGVVLILGPKTDLLPNEAKILQKLNAEQRALILCVESSPRTSWINWISSQGVTLESGLILEQAQTQLRDQKEFVPKSLKSSFHPLFSGASPLGVADRGEPLLASSVSSWLQNPLASGQLGIEKNGPFTVGVRLKSTPWLIFSDVDWLTNQYIDEEENRRYFLEKIALLTGAPAPVKPDTQTIKIVDLGGGAYGILFFFFVLIAPFFTTMIGVLRWWRLR